LCASEFDRSEMSAGAEVRAPVEKAELLQTTRCLVYVSRHTHLFEITVQRFYAPHIDEDRFVHTTPYGPTNFTDVIASKDPDSRRRAVLAAHFDSKFFPFYPENQACPSITPTFPLSPLVPLTHRVVVCRSNRLCRTMRHHARYRRNARPFTLYSLRKQKK
jgi:hypothetical protein